MLPKAVLRWNEDAYDDIRSSTYGIIFLGTPHLGSEHAAAVVVLQHVVAWARWKSPDSINITKELRPYSTTVIDIDSEFLGKASRNLKLISFRETVKTRLPTLTAPVLVCTLPPVLSGGKF